jgi:crotonobetaine/carnitine-CoA ligase
MQTTVSPATLGSSRFLDHDIRDMTIGRVLERRAATLGEKVFLTYLPTGRTYTYRECDLVSNRWANALMARGIGRGSHVAVMMENCAEQLLLYFALGKIGAMTVPVNTAARGELLAYFLTLSDSTSIIVDMNLLDRVVDMLDRVPDLSLVIGIASEPEMKSSADCPGLVDFGELDSGSEAPVETGARFDDPAFIAFTSGTTGPSKAVVFTQAAMLLTGLNYARSYGFTPDDVYYISLPLFHASGLRGGAYLSLMSEGSIALTRRFSVSRFWNDVNVSGATSFNLLGAMANFLWNAPPHPLERSHRVRFCRMAPVPHFAREFTERFGIRIVSTYGLTDVGAPASFTLDDPLEKLGSCGRARTGWELKIVDDDDFALPAGQVGEIVIRCNVPWHTASGYYKMPEETLKMMRNGWYHTGDRGYLDEDGFLFFADRKKDALRRRGENISAWEVENIIGRHPAIKDVAIYAVKAETSEDEVAASVVLKEQASVSEADLVEFCRQNMAYFMVPRFVQFVDSLPVNLSLKVEKAKLRAWAAERPESLWDREKAGIKVVR